MKDLVNYLDTEQKFAHNFEYSKKLETAIDKLPGQNQLVIKKYFQNKKSRKAIALELDWPLSRVNQKITRGITLLRVELKPEHFSAMEAVVENNIQRLLRK